MLIKRGNVYWIRLHWNGRLIQRTTRCRNRKAAEQIESQLRVQLAKGEAGLIDTSRAPTLEKFGKQFLDYLPAHVSPRTVGFYTDAWKPLIEFEPIARTRITGIDAAIIEQFVQHRLSQKMKPATVNHSLRTLRRALRLAAEWKLIYAAPKIKMLPGERQREFIISEELLGRMLPLCSPLMSRLLPFLIDTGLRITEALSLTWATVSTKPKDGADRGWVYVAKGKSKYAKRYVPLTQRASEIIVQCRKLSKGDYVFPGHGGKRKLSRFWPSEQFAQITDKLHLPWDCVLHSTRHTFCTNLGESGADAFTIQKLAGHSSITISQRYVHPTPIRLESAIGMLENVVKARQAEAAAAKSGEQKSEVPYTISYTVPASQVASA